ncbi:MAG: MBL fold metallo-hydrolase [Planktomarina sp.]
MRKILILLCALFTQPAFAQDGASHCLAFAGMPSVQVYKANYTQPLEEDRVRISYIAHAMFLIQGGGASAATDYTGFLGTADIVPDVVTMNNSHETHWTANPDPNIPHVLKGWPDANGPAQHWVRVGDMLVRNVTTDTRDGFTSEGRSNGNSIFVFEVAGLCIAHLGHLHQELSEEQYALLGRMDVVMVPVDGGLTLPLHNMIRVMDRARAQIVIPMHWFSDLGLTDFLDAMEGHGFTIDRRNETYIETSLMDLPRDPTVVVLRSSYLRRAR